MSSVFFVLAQLVLVYISEEEFYPLLSRVVLIWNVVAFKVILVGFKSKICHSEVDFQVLDLAT